MKSSSMGVEQSQFGAVSECGKERVGEGGDGGMREGGPAWWRPAVGWYGPGSSDRECATGVQGRVCLFSIVWRAWLAPSSRSSPHLSP